MSFFQDYFGMRFVPASTCSFKLQAVRRGLPLYEDRPARNGRELPKAERGSLTPVPSDATRGSVIRNPDAN